MQARSTTAHRQGNTAGVTQAEHGIGSSGDADNPHRLPRNASPRRYDLHLRPDLAERRYTGTVDITLDVMEATDRLVCNAVDLAVQESWVVRSDGTRIDAAHTFDPEAQRVTFALTTPLTPGAVTLHVAFTGELGGSLAGFYASTWTAADGSTRVLGTTQMEPTDARRAFPCWDEPDLKAVFGITLEVEPGQTAISNSPEQDRTPTGDGRVAVRFADTPVMSTYLVCFVVGELECTEAIDVDGVPLRIVSRPGQQALTGFALDIGAFALRYFTEWYGIPYPGEKLDLIAIPDFAMGAMENLGAVTFRETLLLVDEARSTQSDLERIADVVAHEIAHMWFGDLVTMRWWNGLWLNEAFATFAEVSCAARFRPEWDRWTTFCTERGMAQLVDGLHSTRPIEFPVVSPADAEGMFDVLTYEKGASVLRMLEQYLGEDRFRDGVRHYLSTNAYGNTETTDLFDSIEEVTGEPVRHLMDSWIFQGGYPVVRAERDGDTLRLSQERFTYLPTDEQRTWDIPVLVRCETADGSSVSRRALVKAEPVEVHIPADTTRVIVNDGGHGYYRVRYSEPLLASVLADVASLPSVERFQVIADLWAGVLAGSLPASVFLGALDAYRSERDSSVWTVIIGGLGALDTVVADEARPALQSLVRGLLGPIADELGTAPAPGESSRIRQLRGQVLLSLGVLGDDVTVQKDALARLGAVLSDDGSIDGDVATALLHVAAHAGDAEVYESVRAARATAATPQREVQLVYALGSFSDARLMERTLQATVTDEIRSQDAPFVVARMLANRHTASSAWAFVRDRWSEVVERFPSSAVGRAIGPVANLSDSAHVAEITAFFAPGAGHELPQAAKQVDQAIERLHVNAALREREAARLGTTLRTPG